MIQNGLSLLEIKTWKLGQKYQIYQVKTIYRNYPMELKEINQFIEIRG